MEAIQHNSSRSGPMRIFRNDIVSNVEAVGDSDYYVAQALALAAEQKAKELSQIKTQASKDLVSAQQDSNKYKTLYDELVLENNKQIGIKDEQLKRKEREMTDANTAHTKIVTDYTAQISRLEGQLKDHPEMEKYNNLDPRFDGMWVRVFNPRSFRFLDAGGENGTRVHGWEYTRDNGNLKFRLNKVNPKDPTSAWTIMNDGKYLELSSLAQDQPISLVKSVSSKGSCRWSIGSDDSTPPGVFVIRTRKDPYYAISLWSSTDEGKGVKISAGDHPASDARQHWLVVPVE